MATPEEIAAYAYRAGFRGNDLATAVAVALAESNGNPGAVGDVNLQTTMWGPSIGLWQIRSLNADRGTGRLRDEPANFDPARNAEAAYALHAQEGWQPWSVFTSDRYLERMAEARAAARAVEGRAAAGEDFGQPADQMRVLPEELQRSADAVGAAAGRLGRIKDGVAGSGVPAAAFGKLRASSEAAAADEAAVSALAAALGRAQQTTDGRLRVGLLHSGRTYAAGDDAAGDGYRATGSMVG